MKKVKKRVKKGWKKEVGKERVCEGEKWVEKGEKKVEKGGKK
jgi:hypothetical protein